MPAVGSMCSAKRPEMLTDLNKCLELDHGNEEALAGRSFVHVKRGELDLALADVDAALKLSPKDAMALDIRAGILAAKLTKAKPDAEPARAITPFAGDLSLHADVFWDFQIRPDPKDRSKADETAMAAANDAVSHNPQDAMAFANRASLHMTRQAYDKALADLDKALLLDPSEPLVYFNRSALFELQKDFTKARAELQTAQRRGIGGYVIILRRSQLSTSQGKLDEALVDADEAVRLGPRDPKCYINRAEIRKLRREYAQALSDYDEALRLALRTRGRPTDVP